MRKLFSYLALVVLGASLMAATCEKDDDTIPFTNIPAASQSFVSQYFGNTSVVKTEIESNGGYSVDLRNGVEIDFSANGEWTKVDAPDRQSLVSLATSTGFIPQNILTYVSVNYPNNPINSIEKTATGYEVELVGIDADLYFDANANAVVSNGNTQTNASVSTAVQTAANSFLSTYFSSETITRVETENNKVEYKLANGTSVEFNQNGEWVEVDAADGRALTNTAFIPTAITSYLAQNYPQSAINGIEKTATGYEVELVGFAYEVAFDRNGNYSHIKD